MPAEEQPDDDFHEEVPDWWMGKPQPDERISSYNLRKGKAWRKEVRLASGTSAHAAMRAKGTRQSRSCSQK
jgi:hypothetical protein